MSDVATRPEVEGASAPGADDGLVGRNDSKDYWDIVFHQLGRHRLFKVGLSVLALLYAVAIYAPFIANDRPFVLTGIDAAEYDNALRLLRPVALSLGDLVAKDDEAYAAARATTSPATRAEAIAVEVQAAHDRVALMRRYLPDASEEPLDRYEAALDRAVERAAAGQPGEAAAAVNEAKDLAVALRKELKPRAADAAPGPDGASPEGVVLEPVRSYPLFENISSPEVFFMVLWVFVLTWPVWNRALNRFALGGSRNAIRRWRGRKVGIVLGLSLASAVVWTLTTGGQRDTFDGSLLKARLTSGQFVATVPPVFPLIPFGYSETHPEENFRPPTWTDKAEVDEAGRRINALGSLDTPATPVEVRYGEPEANSPWRHVAGVDGLGRDFMTRMIWGARISLSVGILSSLVLTVIGVVIGSLAGYFGGWVDIVVMRTIEIVQSIPSFFLILATMAFTDPSVVNPVFAIVLVIALISWTGVARLVRGEFLRLRNQEFVVAARALGFSNARTIFLHVLPNALSPVLVASAFAVASGILIESAVSYLGFGIQPPKASWGSLVNESRSPDHWWVQVFPGLLIFVTVTCYNLVGDAIRDALDPKMKV
jgi:peptide/nickel transport system permease protein